MPLGGGPIHLGSLRPHCHFGFVWLLFVLYELSIPQILISLSLEYNHG